MQKTLTPVQFAIRKMEIDEGEKEKEVRKVLFKHKERGGVIAICSLNKNISIVKMDKAM